MTSGYLIWSLLWLGLFPAQGILLLLRRWNFTEASMRKLLLLVNTLFLLLKLE